MAKRVDLLNGSIAGGLAKLALPIMGTSMIQTAYNMTDMFWIGRLGAGAVAAVGAGGMFMWMATSLVILARMGGQVRVGQKLGEGDTDGAAHYAQNSIQLCTVLAVIFSLVLILGATPLVAFYRFDSPEVIRTGEVYLRIVGCGMTFSFLGQLLSALITVSGNSRTPLYATFAGLGFNIIMDPLLIFGVGPFPEMGVQGAAIATVAAQLIVLTALLAYIVKDEHLFKKVHFFARPDIPIIREIVKMSFPTALQTAAFAMFSIIMARLVSGYGDVAVGVQKVGSQIESISWMTGDGFAVAVNSFVAQNYGAGNFPRAKKGYRVSMVIITLWGLLCTLILGIWAEPLIGAFIPNDPVALAVGTSYLQILALAQVCSCTETITAGAFQGFGNTIIPSIISISFTFSRIPLSMVLSHTALGLDGIWWAITITACCKGIILPILFIFWLRKMGKQYRLKENSAI